MKFCGVSKTMKSYSYGVLNRHQMSQEDWTTGDLKDLLKAGGPNWGPQELFEDRGDRLGTSLSGLAKGFGPHGPHGPQMGTIVQ